jgi:hypothetical protein
MALQQREMLKKYDDQRAYTALDAALGIRAPRKKK